MKDADEKAFEYAKTLTLQLVTLSTGIVTVTMTFTKDFLGGAKGAPRVLLPVGWMLFLLSVVFGVVTLMGMTSQLDPQQKRDPPAVPSIWSGSVQWPAIVQCLLFLLGLLLTIIAGAIAL